MLLYLQLYTYFERKKAKITTEKTVERKDFTFEFKS